MLPLETTVGTWVTRLGTMPCIGDNLELAERGAGSRRSGNDTVPREILEPDTFAVTGGLNSSREVRRLGQVEGPIQS